MKELFKKLMSNPERELKKFRAMVDAINSKEDEYVKLTDAELLERGLGWQQEFADLREKKIKGKEVGGQKLQDRMDALLPDVFAAVRTAAMRTLGQRHYDVQLIGGMVLHQGRIAEMKTGEGKTLVATLPIALNGLLGSGCHLVTVNDYLARRDAEWMGPIYSMLGLTWGALQNGQHNAKRRELYRRHITYGTNSEFGFDYLRDNMVINRTERVQRPLFYAIVDEVDSILIDEARTPLIISGAGEQSTDLYQQIDTIIPSLILDVHYEKDDKEKNVTLTEDGVEKVEAILRQRGLLVSDHMFDPENSVLLHHVNQALRAHALYRRDVEYVVENGEIIIVDEFTGRKMTGRRYSEGLHQAIEAKERVAVRNENQTLATITIQNYYRLYKKLAGMTGTAKTEEDEFTQIYGLTVVAIPTNVAVQRKDFPDLVYASAPGKYAAVAQEIEECHKRGQPVLVGTVSVTVSEMLSDMLKKKDLPHNVLNAKHHEREAEIVANAGQKGAITVATNMAGRGTDIKLGEGVVEAGGLHIIGTERHESRRIDNQLRGRSGRQGDPGSSRFYLSLEDDLMRIFGSDRVKNLMLRMGMSDEQPLEHPMLTRAVENAQKKVEAHNFEIRKHVLKYDDIMEKQRSVIYSERNRILEGEVITDMIEGMIARVIEERVDRYCLEGTKPHDWDFDELMNSLRGIFPLPEGIDLESLPPKQEALKARLIELGMETYRHKEETILAQVQAKAELEPEATKPESFDPESDNNMMRQIERYWALRMIDRHWIRHLYSLDSLRDGIGLQGYGQRDPLVEYTRESYLMFQAMRDTMRAETLRYIFSTHFAAPTAARAGSAAPGPRSGGAAVPLGPAAGPAQNPYRIKAMSAPTDGQPTGAGAAAAAPTNGRG
ncbi:MAG TPA: preprotein translocase subunit SecA, partial [bacterium]|nr:preprotein translocase subunit SecA [bacterium]